MIKKIKVFAVALGFVAMVSCNDNTSNRQISEDRDDMEMSEEPVEVQEERVEYEEEVVEEEKDVQVDVNANDRKIGVKTKDVDIDLQGEDDEIDN